MGARTTMKIRGGERYLASGGESKTVQSVA